MRRQERKNTVHLQKMTRNRLRIQQFPLTLRSPLHTNIVVNNDDQWGDRHAGLFRAFLGGDQLDAGEHHSVVARRRDNAGH